MTLRDQILVRIDATPYRPPTLTDIAAHFFGVPQWYERAEICIEIEAMLSARLIDTENGDSGLTYTRAKSAPAVSPRAPPATPIYSTLDGVTQWRKRASTQRQALIADCEAKRSRTVCATIEKFKKILKAPMSVRAYADAASSNLYSARNLLQRYRDLGILKTSGGRPCLYRVK